MPDTANQPKTIGVGDWVCSPEERRLVNMVLDSGRLSYGPMSRELEAQFCDIHKVKHGVLSNSGTSSLQVALQAMKELHGWEDGAKVIVPSVTFVATANIVIHNKMEPVFCDVDPYHYNLDWRMLEMILEERDDIVCAIPVHLFGQPADMSNIEFVCRKHNVRIIEDSCECMFATHHQLPVGGWGDIAAFSFYVAHLITSGVGGMSTTNNPDYAAKMRSLVNHGRDGIYISIDDDEDVGDEKLKEIISRRFHFESIGHSFRITELEAALALAQLKTWQPMIQKRQFLARTLTVALTDLGIDHLALPSVAPGNTHSWMMYPIVLLQEEKEGITNYLEQHGIETRDMLPLINQPVYKYLGINFNNFPVANWVNKSGFYVGCHQGLSVDDIYRISEVIHDYFS